MANYAEIDAELIRKELAYLMSQELHTLPGEEYKRLCVHLDRLMESNEVVMVCVRDAICRDMVLPADHIADNLDAFSRRHLAPMVRRLIPDDREFAIESIAYG